MKKSDDNLVIIDADSIVYIVGYELSDMRLEPLGLIKLDTFIKDILIVNVAKQYLGYFGGKGHNFRKDIAITKVYKGNRATEKPEWFDYWEPILKKHMKEVWGFEECLDIEADDACCIAANKYRDFYNKIIIATPDKDLLQIPECWFFDYTKRVLVYCEENTAAYKLCKQLILGDSTDNIPGVQGAGNAAANAEVLLIQEKGLDLKNSIQHIKDYYLNWYTEVVKDKQHKKQEAAYLKQYKVDNDLKRLTKQLKSDALKDFKLDTSMIWDEKQVDTYFNEQYGLIKLLDTEKEGLEHGFKMTLPIVEDKINWDEVITVYDDDEELFDEDIDPEFIENL